MQYANPHWGDLVLSFGTLRRSSFPDRLEAVAAAGYAGIGLTVTEYQLLLASGWTPTAILKALNDFGLSLHEAELIVGFWETPGPAGVPERPGMIYADPEAERIAFELASELGLRYLQVVGTFDSRELGPEVVDAFGALCDRAAKVDLAIALEFVPYTSIPDLKTAEAIVTSAGRSNGGLCVDSWHFFRGGSDLADLERLSGSSVFMIQLNDGSGIPTNPNRMEDAVTNRLLPGDGEFPLVEFLEGLRRAGATCPLSVEVFSNALQRLPSATAASAAASRSRAIVDAVTHA